MADEKDSMEPSYCAFYKDAEEKGLKPEAEPNLPDSIAISAALIGIERDEILRMVNPLVAMWLFKRKAISLGQAADWVGMNMGEFIVFLKEFSVPVVSLTDEEFAAELDFIEKMSKGK